ncbi:MAG TPA: hypothetical protein VFV48_06135, partial [Pseudomonadales bacterium]|nr:hypothetical protein [Pseudomonadales bacterium]
MAHATSILFGSDSSNQIVAVSPLDRANQGALTDHLATHHVSRAKITTHWEFPASVVVLGGPLDSFAAHKHTHR